MLFGSADGWVYCLQASDGALAWRFRAAPEDRRLVAYGQIESLWPVPGNVLLQDGVVYCIAGRSSYLDGGIRLCRLDARTGQMLSETVIDDRDPKTGYQRKGVVHGTNMPGALPDVLSCDGRSIYLRHRRFDFNGQPQPPDVAHLFSSVGFLDDTWWHRTYWMMGATMGTNYGGWPAAGNRVPAGRLLTFDDRCVYGFGRNQYIHHGAHVGIDGATIFHYRPAQEANRRRTYYQAFAVERQLPSDGVSRMAAKRRRGRGGGGAAKKYLWTTQLPILARAAVLTSDTLFFAGPPDIFASDDPEAAWRGKKGGTLFALATVDGQPVAQHHLNSPPVWDGMAAAGTSLYLATTEGKVQCYSGR